jgi:hypothetical protein
MGESAEVGFCRVGSLEVPLAATATEETDAWFVLEYRGAWAAKAWDAAEMPAEVRAHVDAFVLAHPRARIQLMRHVESRDRREPALLLASSRPGATRIAGFHLNGYSDLLQIDLSAALADLRRGDVPVGAEMVGDPVMLVCTNGKRDRCCAKWGQPVYDALRGRPDVRIWQTTHIGGHRFAPTVLWLPDGLCFGRVPLAAAARFVDGLLARELVDLSWYRGRTALSGAAQAVEHAVRLATNALGFDDVELVEVIDADGRVTGRARAAGVEWRVELERETTTDMAPPSCGKPPAPVERWRTIACAAA